MEPQTQSQETNQQAAQARRPVIYPSDPAEDNICDSCQ
jgi:hypothetical protein